MAEREYEEEIMPAKCSIRSALYAAIMTLVAVGLVAKAQTDAQEAADPRSEALKKAAKAGAVSMLGFFELGIARQGPPVPKSGPIPGLDDPNAVPFLIDILENGPSWEDKRLLGWRGGCVPTHRSVQSRAVSGTHWGSTRLRSADQNAPTRQLPGREVQIQ